MPIIAVAGAIGAVAVAGSAVAATAGGIAAISAVTAFEIAAAVGATIGAVGVVTRDKTLQTAGLVIGAVGGIGALASSAGLLGAEAASNAPLFGATPAASTADTAASTGSAFGGVASDASNPTTYGPTAGAFGNTAAADQASAGSVNFVAGEGNPSDLTTLNSTSDNAASPGAATANAPVGQSGANSLTGAGDTSSANIIAGGVGAPNPDLIQPPPAPPNMLGTSALGTGENVEAAVDPVTGKIASLPDGSSGIFGDILKFANDNKVVNLGALQAGGSLLTGLTSTLTPAQVSALNAQAAANNAAASLTNQQTANLAQPKAVAYSVPVTGAPAAILPPATTPGMINRTQSTGVA